MDILTKVALFYGKGIVPTFCLVYSSNYLTSMYGNSAEKKQNMIHQPKTYFTTLVVKSIYYGLFWPLACLGALTNPRTVFVLDLKKEKANIYFDAKIFIDRRKDKMDE
jgi:hypothetical protein